MSLKSKILLFNPRSADRKYRIPNSVLAVAASVEGLFDWVIVDGNRENNPLQKIEQILSEGDFFCFACTVMPGPQLKQAIPAAQMVRHSFPDIVQIWGGYFPSNQPESVLNSGYVDFIVNGMGDKAFPMLLKLIKEHGKNFTKQLPKNEWPPNLIFKYNNEIFSTPKDGIYNPDDLPSFPYKKLNEFYSLDKYLGKTWLGNKTLAYHSSFGCPFTCSFCAVVPIYNARWKGMSENKMYADIKWFKESYGADAIEFHDNNFFVSEKRTVSFSKLMMNENMNWWGEGRIDTIDKYSNDSLKIMRDAGCKMIFFGAETGNDELLKQMDKGGTQNSDQILRFAERLGNFDIIPEYSFVLGTPAGSQEKVFKQIRQEVEFIRKVKSVNPQTEIIIYVYSPVPVKGSELYEQVLATGFRFPQKLEDWISPSWEKFDLRKNPLTPWLSPEMVDYIKNFETVLNAYYPTVSDIRLSVFQRNTMKTISSLRYKMGWYKIPLELKSLQKFWLRYRQPEIQGF